MADKFLCLNCIKTCNGNDDLFISNPYCTGSTCRLLYELNKKATNLKNTGTSVLVREEDRGEKKVA